MTTQPSGVSQLAPVRVWLTGAFLTDRPLDLTLHTYGDVQARVAKRLMSRNGEGWGFEPLASADSAGSQSVGGGYPSLMPLTLVSRQGPALMDAMHAAEKALPASDRLEAHGDESGVTLRPQSARIQFFDFGVGAFETVFELSAPQGTDPRRIIEVTERFSAVSRGPGDPRPTPFADVITRVLDDSVAAYAEAVDAEAADRVQTPWLSPLRAVGQPDRSTQRGRPLFIHRLYMICAATGTGPAEQHRLASSFRSSYSKSIRDWDELFVPGIDSSVMVTSGTFTEPDRFIPSTILFHWGYLSLLSEVDRGLLATLDEVQTWDQPRHLSNLEREAREVFELGLRVDRLLSRLASVLIDFGGGGLALWDALAGVQRFDDVVTSVEKKLEILQRLTEQRVQEAAAMRERRTNNILAFLTALTIVGLAVALADGLFGTRTDRPGHVIVRLIAVLIAFLLALLLFRSVRWAPSRDVRRRLRLGRTITWSSTSHSD